VRSWQGHSPHVPVEPKGAAMAPVVAFELGLLLVAPAAAAIPEASAGCVECHRRERIAAASSRMREKSRHAEIGVACTHCHLHDPSQQGLSLCAQPGVKRAIAVAVCAGCHPREATDFESGGHAQAWLDLERARQSLPGNAGAPVSTRGCASCHRIGENGGRCDFCHTRSSATTFFTEARATIREADRLFAAAVRLVVGLQADDLVPRPAVTLWSQDLLGLVDPGSEVEERLWAMALVHRTRVVLGVVHHNPEYQQRLGWRELRRELDAITSEATKLRSPSTPAP